MAKENKIALTSEQRVKLIDDLKNRFEDDMGRHKGIDWSQIGLSLEMNPEKLWSLYQMEKTGGEPDVVCIDEKAEEYLFIDCSLESPLGRRSVCYDRKALESRKKFKPKNNAIEMANAMGIEVLNETQYRSLQEFGNFDTKTSSWIKTSDKIRKLGGALFADFRFNHVFIYHNGAESYYAARGFRGILRV